MSYLGQKCKKKKKNGGHRLRVVGSNPIWDSEFFRVYVLS